MEPTSTLRDVAREIIDSGHPRAGTLMIEAADRIDDLERERDTKHALKEVDRLRKIIADAIPHQSNAEIGRRLKYALDAPDLPLYHNTNGTRIA